MLLLFAPVNKMFQGKSSKRRIWDKGPRMCNELSIILRKGVKKAG